MSSQPSISFAIQEDENLLTITLDSFRLALRYQHMDIATWGYTQYVLQRGGSEDRKSVV